MRISFNSIMSTIKSSWAWLKELITSGGILKVLSVIFFFIALCEVPHVLKAVTGEWFLFGCGNGWSIIFLPLSIVFGLWLYRWAEKIRISKLDTINNVCSGACLAELAMLDDSPTEADLLGRGRFIDTVIEAIKGTIVQGCHTQYIGIFGPWGCGKTSIYLQVRKTCRERNIPVEFIDFNPWRNQDGGDFAEELCAAMSKVSGFEKETRNDFLITGWRLARLGVFDKIGQALGAGEPFSFISSWFSKTEKLRDRINKKLEALSGKKRIVVVIDDIDRLTSSEIVDVVRLIKTNGGWKNVTYLLLADREYMAAALESVLPNVGVGSDVGVRYLEKVIPVALDVPKASGRAISNYTWEKVANIIDERGLGPQKISDWGFIERFLDNVRSAKRFINTVRSQLYHYTVGSNGRISVDISDFLALTVIRLFEPAFYESLFKHRKLLVITISKHPLDERRSFTVEEMRNLLCPNVDQRRWENIFLFITNRLSWEVSPKASA